LSASLGENLTKEINPFHLLLSITRLPIPKPKLQPPEKLRKRKLKNTKTNFAKNTRMIKNDRPSQRNNKILLTNPPKLLNTCARN